MLGFTTRKYTGATIEYFYCLTILSLLRFKCTLCPP